MPMLLRRREVWLPTLWGWLWLLAIVAALLAALVFGIGGYLSRVDPARGRDGQGARTLVVEGWLDEDDLAQAVAAVRRARYERVLTTGGPIESWNDARVWKTYAERAAGFLRAQGVAATAVPAPASAQDRTFLSAVKVREWAGRGGVTIDALDLYSAGAHARRSRALYRMAFGPGVEIGVLAAAPHGYDPRHWWTTSAGAKTVVIEGLSLIWTTCCFWPPPPDTHEERWGLPPSDPK